MVAPVGAGTMGTTVGVGVIGVDVAIGAGCEHAVINMIKVTNALNVWKYFLSIG